MKNTLMRALVAAAIVMGPLGLTACQEETEVETGPDGTVEDVDRGVGIDDSAIDDATNSAGDAVNSAGDAIENAGDSINSALDGARVVGDDVVDGMVDRVDSMGAGN